MFGIDESGCTSSLLCLGYSMQRNRSLATRLRAVDLDYPPTGVPTNAKRRIDCKGTRRDHGNVYLSLVSHPHDGAFAKLPFDLG